MNSFLNISTKNNDVILAITKILNQNTDLRRKQKKLEKLMNVYLLKEKEKVYKMNPLWGNIINKYFSDYFLVFNNNYNKMFYEFKLEKYYYANG